MRIQKIDGQNAPFYNSTKYSTWVMATGDTGFNPFSGAESSQTLRFYSNGQNLFTQNAGRILAYQAKFFAPNYSAPVYQTLATGAFTILEEISKIMQNGLVSIVQDSNVVHEDVLSNLMPELPKFGYGVVNGAPTNTYQPVSVANFSAGGNEVKRSNKTGIYFTPPLMVLPARNVSFRCTLNAGTVPAALNGYIIRFELTTEELPQSNAAMVRT
jgi:hypothetical protein